MTLNPVFHAERVQDDPERWCAWTHAAPDIFTYGATPGEAIDLIGTNEELRAWWGRTPGAPIPKSIPKFSATLDDSERRQATDPGHGTTLDNTGRH